MKIEGLPEGFEVKEVLLIECESNRKKETTAQDCFGRNFR